MAEDAYSQANEAFVADNYEEAVRLYTEAISADSSKDNYYASRAQAYIKLEKYPEALVDATKAIEINPSNPKAYLRKGVASFNLNEYESALESLKKGQSLDESEKLFSSWIEKCNTKLKKDKDQGAGDVGQRKEDNSTQGSKEIPMPTGPKTRYDWYQTETHVIITIMVKKVNKEDYSAQIGKKNVSVTIKLPTGNDYSLELDLAHEIVPQQSLSKIMSTKIEIKLKKAEGIQWRKLEDDGEADKIKQMKKDKPVADDPAMKYPSSSHYTRDWDKIVAKIKEEEKDEKLEGDAALNQLFQQIYSDGNDEVKRAMNKSFMESGGTVLSTNWKEIGNKQTEVKPPDGCEYKSWEK